MDNAEGKYYLTNENGQKCFYNTKEDSYYFEDREVGYCVWDSESEIKQFAKVMDFVIKTIVKKDESV